MVATTSAAWATFGDPGLGLVRTLHPSELVHLDQMTLLGLVNANQNDQAFDMAFQQGNKLFQTVFTAVDGVGANVGPGIRFTRVPRADLKGPGEWANHTPSRSTGPNAQSCASCHVTPGDDGSGPTNSNVVRDPLHSGLLAKFIQRNTPPTFALGALQRLAEEMTDDLQDIRQSVRDAACASSTVTLIRKPLFSKGVGFGTIAARRTSTGPCSTSVTVDTSGVQGVSSDLVVRPFQWKGTDTFIRGFARDAGHNELGMQAVELVGDGVDGDGDGVTNELSVGDITALAVYMAAQPRPTTKVELASLGLIPPLTATETAQINWGRQVFTDSNKTGCTACHVSRMEIEPIFSEPSQDRDFRDRPFFPAGQDPSALGVDWRHPITFDLTQDQPDNQIKDANGNVTFRLGSFRKNNFTGHAIVELFGDLKRHDMGTALAESIDEKGTGASVFMTENLWGVGTTAPYMHDGRATTLTEAIQLHGGEAAAARDKFLSLSLSDKQALIAFLNNLVLFKQPEAGE